MKISKKGAYILISELKVNELFAFLKCQVQAKLVFINEAGQRADEDIVLISRDFLNNKHTIEVDIDGRSQIFGYDELLNKISEIISTGFPLNIMILVEDFKKKEPLIMLIDNIKTDIIGSCIYLDYDNNTFEIKNKNFKNGDSDVLYYFELNDTILAFSETGPVLITDNDKINSITDLVGN